jgi:hypothetical protein
MKEEKIRFWYGDAGEADESSEVARSAWVGDALLLNCISCGVTTGAPHLQQPRPLGVRPRIDLELSATDYVRSEQRLE